MTSKSSTSLMLSDEERDTMERLKQVFGVSSNAAVVRKALLIAEIAAENSSEAQNESRVFNILTKQNHIQPVILKG